MNTELNEGSPAPDFELVVSGGQTVRLADYKGKSHVVLFFVREYN